MKFLIFDFETTGVDTKTCRPLEFASLVYDTDTKERSEAFSTLVWNPLSPPISDEITELTGISRETMDAEGWVSEGELIGLLTPRLGRAGTLCAYNASFDLGVIRQLYHGFEMRNPADRLPVFCAMGDLPYPARLMRCRQLQHRALDLGLPMDGRRKHRAMADVETVADIFDLYDMREVLAYHAIPWAYFAAQIPEPWKDGGRGRDLAKAAGFGWEQAPGDERKFPKRWVTRLKESQAVGEYPFPIEALK